MRWLYALANATGLFDLGLKERNLEGLSCPVNRVGFNRAANATNATTSMVKTTPHVDAVTSLTYSSFSVNNITFRVAVPVLSRLSGDYPVVVQIVAPVETGWVGFAWGGNNNPVPLTVAWLNNVTNQVVISSRQSNNNQLPGMYPSAEYTTLPRGTFKNATHWQMTAVCTGCSETSTSNTGTRTWIDPTAANVTMGWAIARTPPTRRTDSTSPFAIHDSKGLSSFNMVQAANANFRTVVETQLGLGTQGAGTAAAGAATGTGTGGAKGAGSAQDIAGLTAALTAANAKGGAAAGKGAGGGNGQGGGGGGGGGRGG